MPQGQDSYSKLRGVRSLITLPQMRSGPLAMPELAKASFSRHSMLHYMAGLTW